MTMQKQFQLILTVLAACGLMALVGCASDQPASTTTTTTTEETTVQPAPTPVQ
jgi:hypothetical protein